jgi:hypothetical protein
MWKRTNQNPRVMNPRGSDEVGMTMCCEMSLQFTIANRRAAATSSTQLEAFVKPADAPPASKPTRRPRKTSQPAKCGAR